MKAGQPGIPRVDLAFDSKKLLENCSTVKPALLPSFHELAKLATEAAVSANFSSKLIFYHLLTGLETLTHTKIMPTAFRRITNT